MLYAKKTYQYFNFFSGIRESNSRTDVPLYFLRIWRKKSNYFLKIYAKTISKVLSGFERFVKFNLKYTDEKCFHLLFAEIIEFQTDQKKIFFSQSKIFAVVFIVIIISIFYLNVM